MYLICDATLDLYTEKGLIGEGREKKSTASSYHHRRYWGLWLLVKRVKKGAAQGFSFCSRKTQRCFVSALITFNYGSSSSCVLLCLD